MFSFKHKITMFAGETLSTEFQLTDDFDNPADLTGFTAKMQIRDSAADETDTPKLELTTENGGIIIDPDLGYIRLYHPLITMDHNGVYDVFLFTPGGDTLIFVQPSPFKVTDSVTHV